MMSRNILSQIFSRKCQDSFEAHPVRTSFEPSFETGAVHREKVVPEDQVHRGY